MPDYHFGDQINMHNGGIQIGKIQNGENNSQAILELRELIADLQRAGVVNEHGRISDPELAAAEISRRVPRLEKLCSAIRAGAGPLLQQALGGAVASFIVSVAQQQLGG